MIIYVKEKGEIQSSNNNSNNNGIDNYNDYKVSQSILISKVTMSEYKELLNHINVKLFVESKNNRKLLFLHKFTDAKIANGSLPK